MRTGSTLGTALVLTAAGIAQAPAPPRSFAFVDVNVLPMDADRALERQTVLVEDRRIVAIGPGKAIAVPDGTQRIDGAGAWLLPGLAEMHGHLPLRSPNLPARWSHDALFLYVANGVTSVRGMQGREPHLEMRAQLESGELLGPRIWVASPPLTGNSVKSADDGERMVREYRAAGYDLLKIHEGIAPDAYDRIAATAHEVGIPFGGHVPDGVGFFRAIEAGQLTIDHLDNMFDAVDGDLGRIGELVDAVRDRAAWVVATEVLWETAFLSPGDPDRLREERGEVAYVPRAMVAQWSGMLQQQRAQGGGDSEAASAHTTFRRRLVQALEAAGGRVLLGTDSPQIFSVPGFAMHREMQVMAEAGMTPYQVLVSGTRRVAEYFGIEATSGTVAVGKRADLLLLEGDPRADLAQIGRRRGVMINGRWLPESEIREKLEEIRRAYAGG